MSTIQILKSVESMVSTPHNPDNQDWIELLTTLDKTQPQQAYPYRAAFVNLSTGQSNASLDTPVFSDAQGVI